MTPGDISGDLLGLSLVEANLRNDLPLIESILSEMRSRGDLRGALRAVSNAFSAVLRVNLGEEVGARQIALFREAMMQDFYGSAEGSL